MGFERLSPAGNLVAVQRGDEESGQPARGLPALMSLRSYF